MSPLEIPTPWQIIEDDKGFLHIHHPNEDDGETQGDLVATVFQDERHAHLLAAAPELLRALTSAKLFIEKLTADVSNRVYRSEECREADAWKDVDSWRYDGDLASLEYLMADAIAKATGADA